MKIAYFTAGTLGAGHVVRGLAIGRALERAAFRGQYRIWGPSLRFPIAPRGYEVVPADRDELEDPRRAGESKLAAMLHAFKPDVLLVDLFWVPLRHLLPLAGTEVWLLLRICPEWWLGPAPYAFQPSLFRRILAIEPMQRGAVELEQIDPIVCVNPDERRSREELFAHVGAQPGERLIFVTQAGACGELEILRMQAEMLCEEVGSSARIVEMSLRSAGALFPVAAWLGGADFVVSGAGYNAYWESRWLEYFEQTRYTAFARKIDDQSQRLRVGARYVPQENGADRLVRDLLG